MPEQLYESSNIQAQPADRIVVFTDGVVEQADAQREQFGLQRTLQLLADSDNLASMQTNVVRLRGELLDWDRNVAPLAAYCRDPRRAPDRTAAPLRRALAYHVPAPRRRRLRDRLYFFARRLRGDSGLP
jgi:hypothetical protein